VITMPRYDVELTFKGKLFTDIEDKYAVDISTAKYMIEEDLRDFLQNGNWGVEEVEIVNFKKTPRVDEPTTTVHELARDHALLYKFDYRDPSSRDYADLNELLEFIGYELIDKDVVGEYSDIKGYFACRVRML